MTEKLKPREKPHYVNNRQFSYAVVDYVTEANDAKAKGEKNPVVTDYIATCFMKICEGLSHKPNFVRYTYRDEMVMDGVENCLKAIYNYRIDASTRTGKPNAFSYFTQIAYFAFIRRIVKEKKQADIKFKFITVTIIYTKRPIGASGHIDVCVSGTSIFNSYLRVSSYSTSIIIYMEQSIWRCGAHSNESITVLDKKTITPRIIC